MRTIGLAIVTLSLVLSFPLLASAKKKSITFDMSRYTCGELLQAKDEDMGMLLVWIDGYLSGRTGDTRVDMNFLNELALEVGKACAQDGTRKLLDLVDELVQ
jgi:hypothetical protein